MSWTYSQSTGQLRLKGKLVAGGYSGLGIYKNDPDAEARRAEGPIPRGRWKIIGVYDSAKVGPYALALTPIGHDAHGRTDFRIHGDSAQHPGGASNGCIVPEGGLATRKRIWTSGDHDLEVIR